MRNFLALVGPTASGKSHFVSENNLEPYTVSTDSIRLMLGNLTIDVEGLPTLSQDNHNKVFQLAYELIETRMRKGAFIVFDATNLEKRNFQAVKKLADKYRYRTHYKLFTGTKETLRFNNSKRFNQLGYVPEHVIDRQLEKLLKLDVPESFRRIVDLSEIKESIEFYPVDHENIWFIGDIHSQADQLRAFLKQHYNVHDHFVFLGDYLDRGDKPAETMQLLLDIKNESNITFLEGNHEWHLRKWAEGWDEPNTGKTFLKTARALEEADISKSRIRDFCRKLATVYAVNQKGKNIFACHGMVPTTKISYLPASAYIKGVGNYDDLAKVYNTAKEEDVIFLHGHRNVRDEPIQPFQNIFNLDGHVEQASGELRAVRLSGEAPLTVAIPNKKKASSAVSSKQEVSLAIEALRNHNYITERPQPIPYISSFNFNRAAFHKGEWDENTTLARALYLDTKNNQVFARAYPKIFNAEEYEKGELEQTIEMPLKVWRKENGFLCLVKKHPTEDRLVFMTKAAMDTEYAGIAKEVIERNVDVERTIRVFKTMGDITLVFEVIDPIRDPHIIKYNRAHCVLLDAVENRIDKFAKLDYGVLTTIAKTIKTQIKLSPYFMHKGISPKDALSRIEKIANFEHAFIEGFVIEDASGFMWKQKTIYYNRWKRVRSILNSIKKIRRLVVPYHALDEEQTKFFRHYESVDGLTNYPNASLIELRDWHERRNS